MFNIKKQLTDDMSLEIDEQYKHDEVVAVHSEINEYLFYEEFVKDEMNLSDVKDKLYDAYLQK